jgi:hypothetical protein
MKLAVRRPDHRPGATPTSSTSADGSIASRRGPSSSSRRSHRPRSGPAPSLPASTTGRRTTGASTSSPACGHARALVSRSATLPLFIDHGVTGVRRCGGFGAHQEWRQRIESGFAAGAAAGDPRGPGSSDGPQPMLAGNVRGQGCAEGRGGPSTQVKDGGSSISSRSTSLLATATRFFSHQRRREAKTAHIAFAVKRPVLWLSASEAADAGMRSHRAPHRRDASRARPHGKAVRKRVLRAAETSVRLHSCKVGRGRPPRGC